MSFIIRGRLCGYLCENHQEPLTNSLIRIYRGEKNQGEFAVANPKDTIQVLNDNAIAAKARTLLKEVKLDENGHFEAVMDKNYDGETIVIDAVINQVPFQQNTKIDKQVQFTITTLQPRWRAFENDFIFHWDYCLPQRFWCAIRALFDAWTICGYIRSCEDNQTPIVGVKITAFDADWLQDDTLGSAITNGAGFFRIDYQSRDFKQTFLSPIINIETPFPPYNSGPDVYFKIESAVGQMIYEETKNDGKVKGRANRSNCFCVQLCVKFEGTNPDTPLLSQWTGIGTAFTIPLGTDLNSFDANGYAGSLKYALTGNIRMTGQVAISSNNKALQGNAIEYRFLVSDTVTGVNGSIPIAAANFSKIVGVDTGLFASNSNAKFRVGQMSYVGSPLKLVDIFAAQSDFDSEGWLDVNKSVLRTFTDRADLNPADLSNPTQAALWHWIDLDNILAINTAALTDNVMPTVTTEGDSVPSGDRKGLQKIAIRFEIREVINKAASQFNYLAGSGQTLNAVFVNNDAALMKFKIKEHITGPPCSTLSNDINAAYTVHHPHLMNVSIGLNSNDGAVNKGLIGTNLPLVNNTNDSINHLNNGSLSITQNPNNLVLHTCSYIATLSVRRRLHSGDGAVAHSTISRSFYYKT